MCVSCCDRTAIVPSYVLERGDFSGHLLCQLCENHLQAHVAEPLIELDALTPAAEKVIGVEKIAAIRKAREELIRLLYLRILNGVAGFAFPVCFLFPRCPH
eukprot:m.121460 g.121460  ORF g.121460 m.121460 type:complete len:101 (-) comp9607_c0_seq2:566-868(-)